MRRVEGTELPNSRSMCEYITMDSALVLLNHITLALFLMLQVHGGKVDSYPRVLSCACHSHWSQLCQSGTVDNRIPFHSLHLHGGFHCLTVCAITALSIDSVL